MKTLKERIEIEQAFLDGGDVEWRPCLGMDEFALFDVFKRESFVFLWNNNDYRIKPKPLEFWVNVFLEYPVKIYYLSKEEAEIAGRGFSDYVKSVKAREVIDE